MNATPTPTHSMSPPSVQSAWINSAHDQVWVETMFDSSLVRDYGAAAAVSRASCKAVECAIVSCDALDDVSTSCSGLAIVQFF